MSDSPYDALVKIAANLPPPSVILKISLVGQVGDVYRVKDELERGFPKTHDIDHAGIAGRYGTEFIVMPSKFAEPGFVYMMAGNKVLGVFDIGGSKMFLDKWNREGDELKALIERLEQHLKAI